jgi:hypothetical protein
MVQNRWIGEILSMMRGARGDNGDPWLYGTESTGDTQQRVLAGTSPAVAGLSAGGYEIAYQTTGTWRSY